MSRCSYSAQMAISSDARNPSWSSILLRRRKCHLVEWDWVGIRKWWDGFPRSLHSPPFSGRTPLGLRRTRPIQNANFLALELLEFSGDFPVIFRCRSTGLVSPTDFPTDCPPEYHQTSTESPPEMTGQHQKVRRKSTGLQRTPSRQSSLLVLLIK